LSVLELKYDRSLRIVPSEESPFRYAALPNTCLAVLASHQNDNSNGIKQIPFTQVPDCRVPGGAKAPTGFGRISAAHAEAVTARRVNPSAKGIDV
jgi:hypothetical protein